MHDLHKKFKTQLTKQLEEPYNKMHDYEVFKTQEKIQHNNTTEHEDINIINFYTKNSIKIEESLKQRRPEYYSQPLVQ